MNFKKRKIRNNLNRIKKAMEKSGNESAPLQNINSDLPKHHVTSLENFSEQNPEPIPQTSRYKSSSHNTIKYFTIFAGLALVIGLVWITISLVQSLDFGSLIFSFGKDLKKDEAKMTNFLLVGVGGYGHDGSNLTDTIIIASLNPATKTVKMLSIPRDLYINDTVNGGQRINSLYDSYINKYGSSTKAMEKFADTVTSITDIPIQYTLKIDFGGFIKIVDAMGGVTVNVETAIHDTTYPKGETIYYETFDISKGIHELDGETALKYARSRHTSSDFNRAKRQHDILIALKEKALSTNLLTDPARIQSLYNSVSESIETNLSVSEIIELAKLSQNFKKDDIQSRVINDDWTSCGGILYTPNRDYFGGAAVLLPAGNNYDELKSFAKNFFYTNIQADAPIQVLNATKTSGLALNYLNRFSQNCLNVIYYGNATNREQEKSVIYYNPIVTPTIEGSTVPADKTTNPADSIPPAVEVIRKILNAPIVEGIPPEYLDTEKRAPAQVVVEIGQDYKTLTSSDPFSKSLYTGTPAPKTDTTKPATTTPVVPEKPLNSKTTDKTTAPTETSDTKTSETPAKEKPVTPPPAVTPSTGAEEPIKKSTNNN